eukprot:gnl/MRDRNA2_/MRDRNA2_34172_c0_seq1.p1 gnl/MRDRNA2_/MRDRNA2_34172_c0~~gnl/MRDRNA2_/MRDRNA2_34172_c0_seq1.p1  ORF type:complete len:860 (-),score=100.18 gnl/MRDRNA2_/MRDRNA2_34172_c0_seq1:37-2616(-)
MHLMQRKYSLHRILFVMQCQTALAARYTVHRDGEHDARQKVMPSPGHVHRLLAGNNSTSEDILPPDRDEELYDELEPWDLRDNDLTPRHEGDTATGVILNDTETSGRGDEGIWSGTRDRRDVPLQTPRGNISSENVHSETPKETLITKPAPKLHLQHRQITSSQKVQPTRPPQLLQSERYRRAKFRNFHKMYKRHLDFFQASMSDPKSRKHFFLGLTFIVICPFIMYVMVWNLIMWLTRTYRRISDLVNSAVKSMKPMVFLLCFAMSGDMGIRSIDFHGHRWIQVDFEKWLGKACVVIFGVAAVRCLGTINHHLEEKLLKSTVSAEYHTRREFMSKLSSPSNVEPVQDYGNTQEEIMFKQVWMPFYALTATAICVGVCLELVGNKVEIYVLAGMYLLMLLVTTVFGAHTIGPDLYGGVVLMFEKPFLVGDIVSVEDKGGAGGCENTVCTGFVERISLRSTAIRRFDMRLCTVPNSSMFKCMVANWARPRKLICLEFGISHRSTLATVKRFSEETRKIIKNHQGVDQELYTKAVFNSLKSGYKFKVICFNTQGTKKQVVLEDLIFRISSLARCLGIEVTFQEQSLSVSGEQITKHYLHDSEAHADADVKDVIPAKKEVKKIQKVAPDSFLLVRVEKLSGCSDYVKALEKAGCAAFGVEKQVIPLFIRVTYCPAKSNARYKDTASQILHLNAEEVFFGSTLEFKFPEKEIKIVPWAKLEVFARTGVKWSQNARLGRTTIDFPELARDNTEYATIPLQTALDKTLESSSFSSESSGEEACVTVKVFLGKNLQFASDSMNSDYTPVDHEGLLSKTCPDQAAKSQYGAVLPETIVPSFHPATGVTNEKVAEKLQQNLKDDVPDV